MAHRANQLKDLHAATVLVVAVVLSAGMANTVGAQPPVGRNFERNAPAIGAMMPDVVVHDHDGTELPLRDLVRKRYTVLILGCLT